MFVKSGSTRSFLVCVSLGSLEVSSEVILDLVVRNFLRFPCLIEEDEESLSDDGDADIDGDGGCSSGDDAEDEDVFVFAELFVLVFFLIVTVGFLVVLF